MHPSALRSVTRCRTASGSLASALRSSPAPAARYYSPSPVAPSPQRVAATTKDWENGAALFGLVGLFVGSWIALRQEAAAEEQQVSPTRKLRIIPMDELRRHRAGGEEDDEWWVAVEGKVYDVTSYAPSHPIGRGAIEHHAGEDVTELFKKVHRREGTLGRAKKAGVEEVGILVSEGQKPGKEDRDML